MKARNIIGGGIAAIGLFLAIETTNGSDYELALRFLGLVMTAAGAYVSKAFDFQEKKGETEQ